MTKPVDLLLGWLKPGTVCLVTGCNGSGKSRLLTNLWKASPPRERQLPVDQRDTLFSPNRARSCSSWVLNAAAEAFPNLADKSKLDKLRTNPCRGLRVGLSYLWAVDKAGKGELVLIDDACEGLHPYAVRSLFADIQEKAQEKDLRVVLASQNTILMNEFNHDPENVLVFHDGQLRHLTDIHPPAYLSHFSLGDLYERDVYGGPLKEEA